MSDLPANGSIIRYPYMWHWQYESGETEGRKERPVCMMLAIPRGEETHLVLLAISGTPPRYDHTALEIPPLECRRSGIREWKESWITVSEFNYDIAERSYYYDPNAEVLGTFSKGFLARIAEAARPFISASAARVSRR